MTDGMFYIFGDLRLPISTMLSKASEELMFDQATEERHSLQALLHFQFYSFSIRSGDKYVAPAVRLS